MSKMQLKLSPNNTKKSLGIVIVTYEFEESLETLIKQIVEQKKSYDSLVVVDNHPKSRSAKLARKIRGVDIVRTSKNIGFGASCNLGASFVVDDVAMLLFLNPDIILGRRALENIRTGFDTDWSAWMGLLLTREGLVNSAGNVLHYTGLSWCDGYLKQKEEFTDNINVTILSGACLAIKKQAWLEISGFSEDYFIYYEDTDISLRLLEAGHKLGLMPSATFYHNYDYFKSKSKWFYIERNRYLLMLLHWPVGLLVASIPVLLLSEIFLWVVSIYRGLFLIRVHAVASFLVILPKTLKYRWAIRRNNKLNSFEFVQLLHSKLDNILLGRLGVSIIVNWALTFYYRVAYSFFKLMYEK